MVHPFLELIFSDLKTSGWNILIFKRWFKEFGVKNYHIWIVQKTIATKFKRLRKGLRIWARNTSDLKKIIENTNFMILCYDYIEDVRELTLVESNSRVILKAHLESMLKQLRLYWKQRATIRQIKVGEANTKYF